MWFGPTALDSLQHFLFHHLILANLGFIGLKLQSGTSLEMFFVAGKMESDCNNHDETLPGYNFLHSQRHLFHRASFFKKLSQIKMSCHNQILQSLKMSGEKVPKSVTVFLFLDSFLYLLTVNHIYAS